MKIIKSVLIGFCVLIATVLLYLIVILFSPILSVPKQPIPKREKEDDSPKHPPASRQDVQFAVNGINISAWLYLPHDTSGTVPCIIMNHGFAGTKDFILEKYALRFIEEGYAVLTYDYRYFGESEGEPRQQFDVLSQLEDLRVGIAYARNRSEINPEKIVLWGTSASGGYGLAIAAEDTRIPSRASGVFRGGNDGRRRAIAWRGCSSARRVKVALPIASAAMRRFSSLGSRS